MAVVSISRGDFVVRSRSVLTIAKRRIHMRRHYHDAASLSRRRVENHLRASPETQRPPPQQRRRTEASTGAYPAYIATQQVRGIAAIPSPLKEREIASSRPPLGFLLRCTVKAVEKAPFEYAKTALFPLFP